ncbi:MAG: hypothetical protein ACLFVT_00455 [Syntrophobacteria bacterium]
MDEQWLDKVKPIFQQARKDLYYPPITRLEPARIETIEIAFSRSRYRILLGEGLVEKFSEEALLGVFHHELNHWAKHPYDVRTLILEQHWLGDAEGKDEIRNFFDDVVVNLDLVVNRGLEQVAQAFRELPPTSKVDNLLRAFYTRVTGVDFGGTVLSRELEQRTTSLRAIDFLDLSKVQLKGNIRRFAKIVEDLLEGKMELPFMFFSFGDFRSEDIRRAMREVAGEVMPQEYQRIASELLDDLGDPGGMLPERPSGGVGISPGTKQLVQQLTRPEVEWYANRCSRYSIFVESLIRKGSLYPDQIVDFELDDGIDTLNPVESYGKILPSLAKKYELAEFERYGQVSVPDAVLVIDSSGSMPNPDGVVSYAVLGAFAVAHNYLQLGARVGVVNFSNVNVDLGLTRNKQKIYEMLKMYQGYGTTLHLDDFHDYVSKLGAGAKDYILITDAGIDNLRQVGAYLANIKGRVTIIWLSTQNQFVDRFRDNYRYFQETLPPSVTFVEITREEDIPRIAVGKTFAKAYASD